MTRPTLGPAALRTLIAALTASAALAASGVSAAGGTIQGKVDATPPKYLPETVVYLQQAPASGAPTTVNMDQRSLTFVPHVIAIGKGDTVDFLNHDTVAHNVYSPDQEGFNLGSFKQNEERKHTFDKEGGYSILCSIHPEMLAYVFVAPSRYAAVVDAQGHYAIKDVPPGTYQLAVWNSHLKAPPKSVTVAAAPVEESFSLKR